MCRVEWRDCEPLRLKMHKFDWYKEKVSDFSSSL